MAKSRKKKRTSGRSTTGGRPSAAQPPAAQTPARAARAAETPVAAAQPESGPRPASTSAVGDAGEPESSSRRVAWWALLAMVVVVPIAMTNLTFLGVQVPLTFDVFDIVKMSLERILGLVALGAWSWDMLRRGGKLRRTPVDWLILVFLAWVALTTVTSIHWPTALFGKPRRYEGLLSFVNYAVIYFLVLQFAVDAARVRRLAQALFLSSIVVAGYGLLQYLGWDPVSWGPLPFEANRAFSTYGNPDLLGGFLIFSVTVALGLALFEARLWWRLAYWAGFGLNGLVLIVAFTRGAWIGGAAALAILGVAAWRQRVRLFRIDWLPAGASLLVGVLAIVRSLSSTDEVMNFGKRLASIFEFRGGSGRTRTEIWQAAITAIEERPVLGWGADTFRLVFPTFKPVEYVRDAGGQSVADNAHNYPLQLASGVGIPGMLLFYGVFVWAGVRSARTVFKRTGDPVRILVAAFWAAAAGYLVQLFFGLSVTGVAFLLWIALAVVLAPTSREVAVRAPRWGAVAGVVVLCACAVGIGYQGVVLAADRAFMVSQSAATLDERTEAVQRAVRLNPHNPSYRWSLGMAYADEVRGYLRAGFEADQRGEDTAPYAEGVRRSFALAETAFKDAIAYVPDEYDNYVALAELYNVGGETLVKDLYQRALDVGERALEVEPFGTSIRVQMARALLGQGRAKEAIETLRYVLKIDPRSGQAALVLADVYAAQGKLDEALELLRGVDAQLPGQPGVAEAIQQLEASRTP